MTDVERKLDAWKKQLIDLGKRNPLISMKTSAKNALCFEAPSMFELWNRLVVNEEVFEFDKIIDMDEDDEDEDDEDDDFYDDPYVYGKVRTNHPRKETQRILRNLRKKAKTAADEQGINVLFMTFGILEWKDASYSANINRAPLVIVPVSLDWESFNSPICLSVLDDEITLNPAIRQKFKEEFNCELPDFSPEDDIEKTFKRLDSFAMANGFEVKEEVYISILSYTKIGIYRDIERHMSGMVSHPLIRAISGDGSGLKEQNDLVLSLGDFNHDAMNPTGVFQIVDADSSQQDAIAYAKNGVSFVLQGPPGTGKSQTITNIIAEQIAAGKKVLFVSEKKAALDVVFRRLRDAGLGDFCFILHDTKANKKSVVGQLGTVLDMSSKKAEMSEAAKFELDELVRCRDALNGYADELNKKIKPLNKSVFQANGEISYLDEIEDVLFTFPNVSRVSESDYRNIISLLNRMREILSRITVRISENPWRNSVISYVTAVFRQDLNAKGKHIEDCCNEAMLLSKAVADEMGIDRPLAFKSLFGLSKLLHKAQDYPGVPSLWFESGKLNLVDFYIQECKDERRLFESRSEDVEQSFNEMKQVMSSLVVGRLQSLTDRKYVLGLKDGIQKYIQKDSFYNAVDSNPTKLNYVKSIVQRTLDYNEEKAKILKTYSKDLFDIETEGLLRIFKSNEGKFSRFLKPSYRRAKKEFLAVRKETKRKYTDHEAIVVLKFAEKMIQTREDLIRDGHEMQILFPLEYSIDSSDLKSVKDKILYFEKIHLFRERLLDLCEVIDSENENHEKRHNVFGGLYHGFTTDWDYMDNAVQWTRDLLSLMEDYSFLNGSFIEGLCGSNGVAERCGENADRIDGLNVAVSDDLKWFSDCFEPEEGIGHLEISRLAARVYDCRNNMVLLDQWNEYNKVKKECVTVGLEDYIRHVEGGDVSKDHIVEAFKKRFFRLWIDSVVIDLPEVKDFSETRQDEYIRDFRRLDKEQFVIARKAVKARLINGLPNLNSFSTGQVNILRRELVKQRKLMSVRNLFGTIPSLIMTLKPCLMMSPLSVSQYLESDYYKFDTVIFDEASQVKTENALGAVYRAKQVIIAGDSKQLPPTSFFMGQGGDSDYDDEDDDDPGILDASLLEEALSLPSRELLWHYRSKHEHLIAFSNAKIYRNRLVSFPSNRERSHGWGVEYIHVADGFYNGKGRPKGNINEAKRVADEVFKHFKEFPDRSLGVVAFGSVQEDAIETQINIKRQLQPEYEQFFREDTTEPFFIKSLENVQGDERDTIIFSIGYAKDKAGVMKMNFGPLSKAGGERRLNVAITRAKYNVKLVGSILPTDIVLERIKEDGPKLLRKYIEYAISGPEVLEQETSVSGEDQFDSPFEESVHSFLTAKGYHVDTQVGCSGYRIDLAVKHPKLSGIYVLGIECDGAMYHSSKTARERDRLRQSLLEGMGWKLYRIWSTDWIKDMVNEKKRLIEAIEGAISGYTEMDQPIAESSADDSSNFDAEDYMTVTKKESVWQSFDEYQITKLWTEARFSYHKNVYDILKNEGPVHHDVIIKRFSEWYKVRHYNVSRLKQSERQEIERTLSYYNHSGEFRKKGDFYSLKESGELKIPRTAGDRKINEICPEELELGMMLALKNSCGVSEDELIKNTAYLFGYEHIGANIKDILGTTFNGMKRKGKLKIVDGIVQE